MAEQQEQQQQTAHDINEYNDYNPRFEYARLGYDNDGDHEVEVDEQGEINNKWIDCAESGIFMDTEVSVEPTFTINAAPGVERESVTSTRKPLLPPSVRNVSRSMMKAAVLRARTDAQKLLEDFLGNYLAPNETVDIDSLVNKSVTIFERIVHELSNQKWATKDLGAAFDEVVKMLTIQVSIFLWKIGLVRLRMRELTKEEKDSWPEEKQQLKNRLLNLIELQVETLKSFLLKKEYALVRMKEANSRRLTTGCHSAQQGMQ